MRYVCPKCYFSHNLSARDVIYNKRNFANNIGTWRVLQNSATCDIGSVINLYVPNLQNYTLSDRINIGAKMQPNCVCAIKCIILSRVQQICKERLHVPFVTIFRIM